jgi:hypothetical protein
MKHLSTMTRWNVLSNEVDTIDFLRGQSCGRLRSEFFIEDEE